MGDCARALMLLAFVAPLWACATEPLSPEDAAAYHRFQVGCRAEDANGYEQMKEYCDAPGGGGNTIH